MKSRKNISPLILLERNEKHLCLSLLETCEETMDDATDLIIVENPEIFLHPKLQNESGDILYRLSKKSQVIFLLMRQIFCQIL